MALIQVASVAYQAATSTKTPSVLAVSTSMDTSDSGGLLQQISVPTHGYMHWATITSMSNGSATFEATAYPLVASGIKTSTEKILKDFGVN